MKTLSMGDLQIALPAKAKWREFDDGKKHGLSHCMKAVDFIVELNKKILFIEIKDPDNPAARPRDREKFLTNFLSGDLDSDLKTKYRDSFLYEWGFDRVAKPIYYLVLIGASSLSEAELLARTDALRRLLPIHGPGDKSWKRPFVAGCSVFNIETWNKTLKQFPVSRLSARMLGTSAPGAGTSASPHPVE